MTTDNFFLLIQTSQTGGQRYSDTSPSSIPCERCQVENKMEKQFEHQEKAKHKNFKEILGRGKITYTFSANANVFPFRFCLTHPPCLLVTH